MHRQFIYQNCIHGRRCYCCVVQPICVAFRFVARKLLKVFDFFLCKSIVSASFSLFFHSKIHQCFRAIAHIQHCVACCHRSKSVQQQWIYNTTIENYYWERKKTFHATNWNNLKMCANQFNVFVWPTEQ